MVPRKVANRVSVRLVSPEENSKHRPLVLLKMRTAISQSQRMDSSRALSSNPFLCLINVICATQTGIIQWRRSKGAESGGGTTVHSAGNRPGYQQPGEG